MAFNIIPGLPTIQNVDLGQLGPIAEDRAASLDGLTVNHEYTDLRGLGIEELEASLAFEEEAFRVLEENGYSEDSIEEVDEGWTEEYVLPSIDFGMGSAVAALSMLGCVPISSCRGRSLGAGHRHPAPSVTFYADKQVIPALIVAAANAGISIENNHDMVEIYAADLRNMHRFAKLICSERGEAT